MSQLTANMKIVLLLFTLVAFCQAFNNNDYQKIIEELSTRIAESQVSSLSNCSYIYNKVPIGKRRYFLYSRETMG